MAVRAIAREGNAVWPTLHEAEHHVIFLTDDYGIPPGDISLMKRGEDGCIVFDEPNYTGQFMYVVVWGKGRGGRT